jgi:predicted transcriptional regulator
VRIEAHVVLQQRRVKVIASCVKTSNGNVSRHISAVMVIKTVESGFDEKNCGERKYLYNFQNSKSCTKDLQ